MTDVRLIDANALPMYKVKVVHSFGIVEGSVVFPDDIKKAPTIDAVPVVRCKCCKNRDTEKCPMIRYDYDIAGDLVITQDHTADNGFCDLGERDEEDEQYSPVR